MKEIVRITDYGMDGVGIAHGKHTYFLPDTILGETVEISFDNTTIKIPSKNRIKPVCSYYFECGGCNLQCMNDAEQQNYKTTYVKNCLKKYKVDFCGKVDYFADNTKNYRNKISFALREVDGKNKIGLFSQKSHNIVEIKDCLTTNIQHKKILEVFKKYISLSDVECYNEQTKKGNLKNVVMRFTQNGVLICVVGKESNFPQVDKLLEMLKKLNLEFSLSFCLNKNPKTILSTNIKTIFGSEEFIVEKSGLSVPQNIGSFFQINDEISSKIYDYVLSNIQSTDTVFDLYSGAGIMTAMLAKKAKFVYGVESNSFAVSASKKLFENNNIKNAECVLGKCEDVVKNIIEERINNKQNFCCVLDPPRKGCQKEVLNQLLKNNFKTIVYVSCEPITLARDLGLLRDKYKIEKLSLFDMFYQTSNIETVAVLKQKTGA